MAGQPIPALASLEQQLLALISERLLEVQPGFNVDSNLYLEGLDSLAIMQLLVLVENEYDVILPERALTHESFSTVRHLALLVREHCSREA